MGVETVSAAAALEVPSRDCCRRRRQRPRWRRRRATRAAQPPPALARWKRRGGLLQRKARASRALPRARRRRTRLTTRCAPPQRAPRARAPPRRRHAPPCRPCRRRRPSSRGHRRGAADPFRRPSSQGRPCAAASRQPLQRRAPPRPSRRRSRRRRRRRQPPVRVQARARLQPYRRHHRGSGLQQRGLSRGPSGGKPFSTCSCPPARFRAFPANLTDQTISIRTETTAGDSESRVRASSPIGSGGSLGNLIFFSCREPGTKGNT